VLWVLVAVAKDHPVFLCNTMVSWMALHPLMHRTDSIDA